MKKVRWGVLSTAKIGVAKVIPGMRKSHYIDVAAIASRDLAAAEAVASSIGIEKAYGSYEDLLADPDGERSWLGTRLEVSRRLRTDPAFRERFRAHSAALTRATRERLERQARVGALRDDVPVAVLAQYLELVLEGLISHLAMGLPADDLGPVLDVVESSVRRASLRTADPATS